MMPLAIGAWAACVAMVPGLGFRLLLGAILVLAPLVWWCCRGGGQQWLSLFLCALIVLPPLPIPVGDSGVHPALGLFTLGLFLSALSLHRWDRRVSPTGAALVAFTGVLLVSVFCAVTISGIGIAMGSFVRVLLFAIGPFTFFYATNGPAARTIDALRSARVLFRAGIAAAIFACVDFYFQLPTPAGFGPQFVWLDQGVFRRAQGLFYEASSLGNFCAFFLVMLLVAFRSPVGRLLCSRWELGFGALVFLVALVLSYSRGSLVNVAVASLGLLALERKGFGRAALVLIVSGASCLGAVYISFPSFAQSYIHRLSLSIQYAWSSPNGVLSGRIDSWKQLLTFLASEPWHAFLGVGYKTLAYSQITGSSIIADNTYLSILVETGVLGFAAFLFLNTSILRTGLYAVRSPSRESSFFGTWIFCFWLGELAQMLSGDLITYWRLLPLYFWVLAQARLLSTSA